MAVSFLGQLLGRLTMIVYRSRVVWRGRTGCCRILLTAQPNDAMESTFAAIDVPDAAND